MTTSYTTAKTQHVQAADGIDYAYREVGEKELPLVLFQHFRGNLDNWDPALIDALAAGRRVVTFDNAGVAGSSGQTPSTVEAMAQHALAFLDALDLGRVDLLGFSLGSFVAQEITLTRPELVHRLVLAAAAPKGAAGMHGWAPEVIMAIGGRGLNPQGYLDVFFGHEDASRQAGQQAFGRMQARTADRDAPTTWATRLAQYDAVVRWGIPNHAALERLSAISVPTLIGNGDSDPMILPHYSYLLAGLIPGSQVKLYPHAAHGFLFQHHEEYAADVAAFLG
ncbi:alpha/beta hydrolase [Diaminobutyricibacter tongyongensis]|uniref:Alpha/beta hydrolase n=1 Tax=Leifsonia tongyongensis TaxID=1268043 RepID=A0A6L9XXY1_9MICO|nr:alpha/beta hydrolase [Diaminobutyricibacter tongyongensis]NEN05848.1 alpha/beta hydrolase [Diaminobutyricibacter tongyongensis]